MKKKRDKLAMMQVAEVARLRHNRAETAYQSALSKYNALVDEVVSLKQQGEQQRAACRSVMEKFATGDEVHDPALYSKFRGEVSSRQLALVRTIKKMRDVANKARLASLDLDALRNDQLRTNIKADASDDAVAKLKSKLELHAEMSLMDDLPVRRRKPF